MVKPGIGGTWLLRGFKCPAQAPDFALKAVGSHCRLFSEDSGDTQRCSLGRLLQQQLGVWSEAQRIHGCLCSHGGHGI